MLENVATWVVMADERHARVFEQLTPGGPLRPMPEHDLEAGGQDSAAHPDAPGLHGGGDPPTADVQGRGFLRQVAHALDAAAEAGLFERLVLLALPRAQGVLRAELDPKTGRLIDIRLPEDRATLTADALRETLHVAGIAH